ncbi:hypothetical protein HDV03_000022 [Kappamyces sp. JEL0829]|nr:hypothetical protein HDV03_000022 [Kappamyces sp. JEL0829]
MIFSQAVVAAFAVVAASPKCSGSSPASSTAAASSTAPSPSTPSVPPDVPAPATFCVAVSTTVDAPPFVLQVDRALAPLGVDHFYNLVTHKFYDDSPFFRVVDKFVWQFGIAGEPAVNYFWGNSSALPLPDDPVATSNLEGTLSYATAGPNTRTTELFINYGNNSRLDVLGFSPFAKVVRGWDTVLQITNPTPSDKGGIDQDSLYDLGNAWTRATYPNVTFIKTAAVVECGQPVHWW